VVAGAANILWYAALPRVGADRACLFYGATPIGTITTALIVGTGSPTPADLACAMRRAPNSHFPRPRNRAAGV
jgi:hypothetical protein